MSDPKKKQKIKALKMDKRVGLYVPNQQKNGITKAPKDQQQTYKKDIKSQIKAVRKSN